MSTRERALVAGVMAAGLLGGCAGDPAGVATPTRGPRLGVAATPAEIALVDISIPPSGAGLPAGSGDARAGAKVYAAKCQTCHGPKGAGKPADALVGGMGTLAAPNPVRTVGSYWPYATTLFDYTQRAMPSTAPDWAKAGAAAAPARARAALRRRKWRRLVIGGQAAGRKESTVPKSRSPRSAACRAPGTASRM